ncbi:protein KHNYN-like [Manacus candei]|uniref:protein KHNYN-like n=1 Tax=Manacus candei TaxID=415023 RepID=UPI0022265027|nr:protein KHNYN-like [Manacus candei]
MPLPLPRPRPPCFRPGLGPGRPPRPGRGPRSEGQRPPPPHPDPPWGCLPVGRGRDRGDRGDARLQAELRGDKTAPPASSLYTGVRIGGSSERRAEHHRAATSGFIF